MKYEVQHYTLCDGWTNTWTIYENEIEKPHVFDSAEEAQAELDEFFQDIENEIQAGERKFSESYNREDFLVVSYVGT